MKQQASVRRTYKKKEMVVARSTLVHLRHSARARNPAPLCYRRTELIAGLVIQSQQLAAGFRPATRRRSLGGHCGVAECRAVCPYSV
ncbi:hypothetical protein GBA52_028751 [Prunus armeniaca]|nr:hypothetical protein GBA52_028751 [Prunus armeniaca]